MIYITGDTHGRFERVAQFCERFETRREDILIILGDAGINFSGEFRDSGKKQFLESLPITIFCIHGNHEQRPNTIVTYKEKLWHGGTVYRKWYCGHYHIEKKMDRLEIMFENVGEIFRS